MKALLLVSLTIYAAHVFGQAHRYYTDKNTYARNNHVKSLSVMNYKNPKSLKGKLLSRESYDSLGNIKNIFEYYPNRRHHKTCDFYYDGHLRLIKIIEKSSFSSYVEIDIFGYRSPDSLPYFYVHAFNKPQNLHFDTIFYTYFPNGSLNYTAHMSAILGKPQYDTIYFHYDDAGAFIKSSRIAADTANRILNEHHCIIGYRTDTAESFRYTFLCDSLCNELYSLEELYIKGSWVPVNECRNRFDGQNLISQVCRSCRKSVWEKCSGKLIHRFHSIYEYNKDRTLSNETSLNARGKIIGFKKYIYEYY